MWRMGMNVPLCQTRVLRYFLLTDSGDVSYGMGQ